ncbi:MAG: hypothetical protein KME29_24810 [Calothrix sp. FI2-JRJ7]|nr:hypothetical protein [Calothrix sp. FI2-JRJ7]
MQLEYAKFRDLQRTGKFAQYMAALGKGNSADGRSLCYAIFANTEFREQAREYATYEGVLLRSHRQATYWLSQSFSLDSLLSMRQTLGGNLVCDLNRNIAPLIASYCQA